MPDDEQPAAQVKCNENGPLVVSGVEALTRADGTAIEVKARMFLCRCGASKNKPFCDGSHKKVEFSGAKQEGRTADQRESYTGKEVTIHDNRGVCSHAGVCTERLPAVWRQHQEPWIDPDGAGAAAIAEVVRRCPSGALTLELASETAEADAAPSIHVSKDGPYQVTGLDLTGEDWGEGAARGRYALCRCGASKNKPFCDGSHWDIGFKDGS